MVWFQNLSSCIKQRQRVRKFQMKGIPTVETWVMFNSESESVSTNGRNNLFIFKNAFSLSKDRTQFCIIILYLTDSYMVLIPASFTQVYCVFNALWDLIVHNWQSERERRSYPCVIPFTNPLSRVSCKKQESCYVCVCDVGHRVTRSLSYYIGFIICTLILSDPFIYSFHYCIVFFLKTWSDTDLKFIPAVVWPSKVKMFHRCFSLKLTDCTVQEI